MPTRLTMAAALVAAAHAQATAVLQVLHPPTEPGTAIRVRLGEDASTVVPLTDRGTVPGDQPGDGIWTGQARGLAPGPLPYVLIRETPDGAPHVLDRGVVEVVVEHDRFTWRVEGDRARRVLGALPARTPPITPLNGWAALVGWGAWSLLLAAWLGRRLLARSER